MKVTCVKKCFYNSKLYELGEELDIASKAKIPPHFKALKPEEKAKLSKRRVADEPKTLLGMQNKQRQEVTLE